MAEVTVKALQRLAQPFIDEGATTLYFSAANGRVYVGREPPAKVADSNATPEVIEVTLVERRLRIVDIDHHVKKLQELAQ